MQLTPKFEGYRQNQKSKRIIENVNRLDAKYYKKRNKRAKKYNL